MRIAVIGSGISGLYAAYKLRTEHDVVVFEANQYIGGHTNTVSVSLDGEWQTVDTGFIVFNDRTYPNFCRMLEELNVDSLPTSMSFSVRSDRANLEYNGSSPVGLFAQKRNLVRPGFYRMLSDILRFNREAPVLLNELDDSTTVRQFLTESRYGSGFVDHYLLPMGAAIWSCPTTTFELFPIRFIVEFYQNHGLLSLKDRPTWRVVKGGSYRYVEALTAGFRNHIRLNSPVVSVRRDPTGVFVTTVGGGAELFDEVIFACHSD